MLSLPGETKPRHGRRYTYPLPEWQTNAHNPTRFGAFEKTSAGQNQAKPRYEGLNLYAVLQHRPEISLQI